VNKSAWKGKRPKDEEEAKQLLLEATLKLVKQAGDLKKVTISRVADAVGVTRRTVYRYFPSTDDLFLYTSAHVGGELLKKLYVHAVKFDSFEERVLETMVYMVKEIPKHPEIYRNFDVHTLSGGVNIDGALAKDALDYSYVMLRAVFPEDEEMPEEAWLRELAEHMVRLLFAVLVAPGPRLRTQKKVRAYFQQWLIPIVHTHLSEGIR
jgi:AcrR family transcriptional regulator